MKQHISFLHLKIIIMELLTWRKVEHECKYDEVPTIRWGQASCLIEDEIVYFGGYSQSCYLNDTWVFNTKTMVWKKVDTFGDTPCVRSNCSMSYDSVNNQVILFGGGSSNKKRFNSVNILNWDNKEWVEIHPNCCQPAPWERTYHSAELVYPYLVIFGGESVSDMDDLWIFDLINLAWKEVAFELGQDRPKMRRFHRSAFIDNKLYVIGGCCSKYTLLNDLYSIDLTPLIEGEELTTLKWVKQAVKGDTSLLRRWGHSVTTFDNKIYIFGGRSTVDLNDITVFDPSSKQIMVLNEVRKAPKGRRRHAAEFVGSCLIFFAGFNGQYFNNSYYINLQDLEKDKVRFPPAQDKVREMVNNPLFSEATILTKEKQKFHLHEALIDRHLRKIKLSFGDFMEKQNEKHSEGELKDFLKKVYCEEEQFLQLFHPGGQGSFVSHQSMAEKELRRVKILDEGNFELFLQINREKTFKNCILDVNKSFYLETNKTLLAIKSKYFSNLFKWGSARQAHLQKTATPCFQFSLISENLVIFEIIINYLLLDQLVVFKDMRIDDWIQLYEMAEFLCIDDIMKICILQIKAHINQNLYKTVLSFATKNKLKYLSLHCSHHLIREMLNQNSNYSYQEASKFFQQNQCAKQLYHLYRFQIRQMELERKINLKAKQKIEPFKEKEKEKEKGSCLIPLKENVSQMN